MHTFGKLTFSEPTPAKLDWDLHDHYDYKQHMQGSLYPDEYGAAPYLCWPILRSRVAEKAWPASWIVEGEPHMRLRLKRLFGRMNEQELSTLRITDSPETCLELLWFMERFPLEISAANLKRLKKGKSQHLERHRTMTQMLGKAYVPQELRDTALPLRHYQKVGRDHWLHVKKFLLGDDLGTGKTALAIGGALAGLLPMVVVVKTHMTHQWKGTPEDPSGFLLFAPWLNVHIAKEGKPYELPLFVDGKELQRGKKSMFAKSADVLVLNYHKLFGWREFIAKWAKAVVYDDCHAVGHDGTLIYQGYSEINRAIDYVMPMTNTPIRNYGGEMFDLLDGLKEGCLGTYAEFTREWCGAHVGQNKRPLLRDEKAFSMHIRDQGLYLRRTRKDCGREVPRCVPVPHVIPCDPGALKEIASRATDLAQLVLGLSGGSNFDRFQASGELDWMLRQYTGIGKAPFAAEFIKMLLDEGEEKIVVGVHHHEVYDILLERLKDYGAVEYSGRKTQAQQREAKRAFCHDKDVRVLLLSNRAGDGLDGIQHACKCGVTAELDWSWAAMFQWAGRFNRDGQEHEQTWYILHAEDGADPFMCARIDLKKRQLEGIRDPHGADIEAVASDPKDVANMARGWLEKQGIVLKSEVRDQKSEVEASA